MTTTSNSRLSEYFIRLPGCKEDGSNWTYFRDRFAFAVDSAGLGDHLDASTATAEPTRPTIADESAPTALEKTALETYAKERKTWRSEQAIIKQAIASCIPDSLFLKVKGEKSALAMWDKTKAEFEAKSRMIQVDLRRRLQTERCEDGGDINIHLKKLQEMREALIGMGADPGKENFTSIILGSLPASYDGYLSALTGAAALTKTDLEPDFVIQGIKDEHARVVARYGDKGRPSGNSEAVFSARRPTCYNCGKVGHVKKYCWAKGGGQEGQGPKGGAGHVGYAKEDDDAAW